MSYSAQTWVNEHAPYQAGAERFVLKELADAMSKDAEVCWPGIARLAVDSGYSKRAVCRALKTMLADGVIERASIGGGRGIKAGYRIVKDKMRWTLSREAMAQMSERAAQARVLEDARRKGDKVTQYRERERVTYNHRIAPETVTSTTEKGAIRDLTAGSYLSYEPVLTGGADAIAKEGDGDGALNPRVGVMLRGLIATMDRKARAGV